MSRQPTILSIGDINLIVPSFGSYAEKFEILSVFDSHVIGYVRTTCDQLNEASTYPDVVISCSFRTLILFL